MKVLMEMPNVFTATSYKQLLEQLLRGPGQRGALSKAAVALGTQVSYLSRVMNTELHLTPDQAFVLGRHLKFKEAEQRYFRLLVDYERAADPGYRTSLQ